MIYNNIKARPKPKPGAVINKNSALGRYIVGAWTLNEGGGTTLHDASGNKLTGTLVNMPPASSWGVGTSGFNLTFDGVTDHVRVGNIRKYLDPAEPWTLFSLKATPTGFGDFRWVVGLSSSTNDENVVIGHDNGAPANFKIGSNAKTPGNGSPLVSGEEVSLALCWDGTALNGYINGELDYSVTPSPAITWADLDELQFGSVTEGVSNVWVGTICSAYLFNKCLTATEIKALYGDPYSVYKRELNYSILSKAPTVTTNAITDNFNRSSSTTIGNNWTEENVTNDVWAITSNTLLHATGQAENYHGNKILRPLSEAWADGIVEIDFSLNTSIGPQPFLMTRCQGTNNNDCYMVGMATSGTRMILWRNSGSTPVNLVEDDGVLLRIDKFYTLQLQSVGNVHTARLFARDNKKAIIAEIKATDSTFAAIGRQAISIGSAGQIDFDNFYAEKDVTQTTLYENCKARYTFNNASGTELKDVTGNAMHLTDNGTVTKSPGYGGTANAAGNYVRVSANYHSRTNAQGITPLKITGDMTIAVRCKADSLGDSVQALVSRWATGDQSYNLRVLGGSDRVQFLVSSTGSNTSSVAIPAAEIMKDLDTSYYLVIAEVDTTANQLRVRLNNGAKAVAAYSSGIFAGTAEFNIGRQEISAKYWDGDIDYVAIWDSILTDEQHAEIYAQDDNCGYSAQGPLHIERMDTETDFGDWTVTGTSASIQTVNNDEKIRISDALGGSQVIINRTIQEPSTDYHIEFDMRAISGIVGTFEAVDMAGTVVATISMDSLAAAGVEGSFSSESTGATTFSWTGYKQIVLRVNKTAGTLECWHLDGTGIGPSTSWIKVGTTKLFGKQGIQFIRWSSDLAGTGNIDIDELRIKPPNIFSIGDSITAGGGGNVENLFWSPAPQHANRTGVNEEETHSWPYKFGLKFSTREWITNRGIGGNRAFDVDLDVASSVIDQGAVTCVIWCGTNDIAQSFTVASIKTSLDSIETQLVNAGINRVWCTIAPRSDFDASDNVDRDTINAHIALKDTGGASIVVDTYNVLRDTVDPDILLPAYHAGGGVHLTQAGLQAVADKVFSVMFPAASVIFQTYNKQFIGFSIGV